MFRDVILIYEIITWVYLINEKKKKINGLMTI